MKERKGGHCFTLERDGPGLCGFWHVINFLKPLFASSVKGDNNVYLQSLHKDSIKRPAQILDHNKDSLPPCFPLIHS